jgi:hypothetical protein
VARNVLLYALFIRVRARHNQVAFDLLSVFFGLLHLIAAVDSNHLRLAVGAAVLHDRSDLTRCDSGLSTRGDVHVRHLRNFCHHADLTLAHEVIYVSASITSHSSDRVASDTHFMRYLSILVSLRVA